MSEFLLYGANGYTGSLVATMAVERGLRPILAGRDADKIKRQANDLGLRHSIFDLAESDAMDRALEDVTVALHCAGPFSRTAAPMAEACLRTNTHYLDITGEVEVFEAMARRDERAREAGIMILPGAGFDVVPSDCLAAHLKRRLPTATMLTLGIQGMGRLSRGTATTVVENMGRGGLVRRDGKLTPVPAGWKTREMDFGRGPVKATTIPWGDVSTAFYSTGIPNIEVYAATPTLLRFMMVASRNLGWLLGSSPVQHFLKRRIRAQAPGPTDAERARGESSVWGEVEDDSGQRRVSRLRSPEGYTLTALTSLAIVERALRGDVGKGFKTPSLAYGADFVLEIEGVVREDLF
jgi:short subunit dehydrogenase-like uncharacterized protein